MSRLVPALLLALLSAPVARAQEPPDADPPPRGQAAEETATAGIGPLFTAPLGDDHLFGDWGGARTWLGQHGIDLRLDYLQESAGNVSGGRRQGATYTGQIGLELDLDLGKLAGLPGLAVHGVVVQGHGQNLSGAYLGDNIDQVQQVFGGRGDVVAHLVYLYAEQSTDDNRLDFAAGWLPVGTYFGGSPLYCDFTNLINCGSPYPLPLYPGEPDWPSANWGGQVRVLPTRQTYVMVGLFDVNPHFGGPSGWNMTTAGSTGVSIPVEIGWVPSFGARHLIGHYKFGFDEDTSTYPDLYADANGAPLAASGLPGAPRGGRRMYYVLVDQMLARAGDGDTDGLIVFGGWVHADADISPMQDQMFAAVVQTGAAFGRPDDTFGVEWSRFTMSGALTRTQELQASLGLPLTSGGLGTAYGIQSREQIVEVMYNAQVWRGINVEPNVQYIVRPGATAATRNALVLGVQSNVQF